MFEIIGREIKSNTRAEGVHNLDTDICYISHDNFLIVTVHNLIFKSDKDLKKRTQTIDDNMSGNMS